MQQFQPKAFRILQFQSVPSGFQICFGTRGSEVKILSPRPFLLEKRQQNGVICESGVQSPEQVAAAFAAGSYAVVVGAALTGIEARVKQFAAAAPAQSDNRLEGF